MSRNSTKPISPIDFSESPQHDALQLLTLWAPSSYSSRSPILSRALARLTVLFVLLAPLLCGVVLGWSLGREFSTVGKHEVPEAAVTGAIPLPPPPPPPLPPHRLLAPAGGVEDLFAVTNEEKAAAFSSSPTAKAPSMVADDEHHLGLFTCLQAHRDKSLHILGVGDSHGRDLVQSPLVRMGVAHVDKERDWTKTAPGYPHITVSHKYLGRPRTVASASKLDRKCQRTHILLSRGTWDLMKYSTPLSKYYAEVQELARSASALDDVTSVTFKTVHRFAAPTAELGFFAECTSADIVGAYRRVGACAVAAHNRQAKPNRRVRVFDAWDVTSRWPREAFADDGHHLVGKYLHAVADAFLKTTVCPSSFSSSSFNVSDGIWASSEVSDIEARFGCADLDLHVTAPDDADKMPSVAPVGGDGKLEQYLKLPSRQGCRCMADGDERVNDHCAFGRLFAALASNSSRYFAPHKAAGSTLSHSSQLLRLPLLNHTSSYVHTTSRILSTAHPQGRDVFVLGEAVLEMCVNPRWSHQCLRNLGVTYALSRSGDSSSPVCQCSATTNFTATEWCRAQKQRVDAVATDLLTFLRYMFQRKRLDMLTTVTGAKEKRLREAFAVVGAHDPWTEPYLQAFLHVGCTPEWQRLPLSDRHGRSKLAKAAITLLQANAERHNANAEQTTTQLQGLRALSAAFEL